MIVIVGFVVVLGAVLAGFSMAGGQLAALVHPSEFVTIGGAALGALILMSSKKVLTDVVLGLVQSVKGSPYNKLAYEELFKALYDLLRLARRDGLIVLESHILNPEQSSIFYKYPKVAGNHHALQFICGALAPMVDGAVKADQLRALMETELKVLEEEHHAPVGVMAKTADALPGFGIVAAVMGIVVTMGAIDGPIAEVGEKVGAALVGTFLGVLLSYGFFGPLSVRMEMQCAAEMNYFRTIAAVFEGFAQDLPPKVAIELARRGVSSNMRPTRERLDDMFAEAEAAA